MCDLCSHKGAVAVRQPYIRIVGMEETNEGSSRGPATFTQEEVNIKVVINIVFLRSCIPTSLHLLPFHHAILCFCMNYTHDRATGMFLLQATYL